MTKRKAGGEPIPLEVQSIIADPDPYLFGGGLSLEDYWIDQSTGFGSIHFLVDGSERVWLISNEDLASALRARLVELGVKVRNA